MVVAAYNSGDMWASSDIKDISMSLFWNVSVCWEDGEGDNERRRS